MSKRFAYVSFGILCLVAAYQLGADRARADWDSGPGHQIVGGTFEIYFDRDGNAWEIDYSPAHWEREPTYDLPIPIHEVRFVSKSGWNGGVLYVITTSDEAWVKNGPFDWRFAGPFPGSPVSLESESLGGVKNNYRKVGATPIIQNRRQGNPLRQRA